MFIPDSRWEMPELLEPKRKPVGQVEIDWSHPLARGLVGCWLLREGSGAIDLTGNNLISGEDATVVHGVDKNGSYAYAGTSSGRIDLGTITSANPLSGNITEEISVYSLIEYPTTAVRYGRIIDISDSGNGANGWTFYFDTLTDEIQCGVNSSTQSYASVSGATAGKVYGFGVSMKTSDTDFYFDGAKATTLVNPAYTWSSTTTQGALLNWNHTTLRQIDSPVYCVMVWDRKLSAVEHSEIHSNPYQFLVPK